MPHLGFQELVIIAVIALLIFGPKNLPGLGSGIGKAIRDFKGAMRDPEPPKEEKKEQAEEKKEETLK